MANKSAGPRGFSDEAVRTKTGKGWDEWRAILDAWGMKEQGHRLTAKHLQEAYGVSPWWAQAGTIRYEYERGLRAPEAGETEADS
jgi:hypothetical protein